MCRQPSCVPVVLTLLEMEIGVLEMEDGVLESAQLGPRLRGQKSQENVEMDVCVLSDERARGAVLD